MWWFFIIFFKFLSDFEDDNFANMMISICIVFGRSNFLRFLFIFCKCAASKYNPIISILIFLNCLLTNFLYPFNQTIMISIRIVSNSSQSSINFNNLFPVWHFTWSIKLNCFEFIRVAIFSLQFICPMIVYITDFFYFYFFVILNYQFFTSNKVYFVTKPSG